jgi:hypothetical protein
MEEIKQEIIKYLQSVGVVEPTLSKALKKVEAAIGETSDVTTAMNADIAKEYKKYLKDLPIEFHRKFNWQIACCFAQKHYPIILGFVERLETAQSAYYEAEHQAEMLIENTLGNQREQFKDDYEYGDVPGEVIIYEDCIIVEANGYREGFKDLLPKGGEYQGKGSGRWKYPISMKDTFTNKSGYFYGMPVLSVNK